MTSVQTVEETELLSDPVVVMGRELLRDLLSTFAHTLMNAEVDARCGASYGQRSKQRVNGRRGYRRRDLHTSLGRVELSIPRLRSGVYRPDWLVGTPEQAALSLTDTIAIGYRHGLSAAQLRELIDVLGVRGIPADQVPDLADMLEARLDAVRVRPAQPLPVQHSAPGSAELADEPRHLATAELLGLPESHTGAPESPTGPPQSRTGPAQFRTADSEPGPVPEREPEPAGAATEPFESVAADAGSDDTGLDPEPDSDQPEQGLPQIQRSSAALTHRSAATRDPRRRLLSVAAALILAPLSGMALYAVLVPQRGGTSTDLQAMMPALVSVIEMPRQITRTDLLAATCGNLHADFRRKTDAEIIDLVLRMEQDFGPRTIDHVERLRRGTDHTAHALVTASAERIAAPARPAKPVDVEFDTSTSPWKICAVQPAR